MIKNVDIQSFTELACEFGAHAAEIIDAGSIVTAPWVRLKCQFGCKRYNAGCCCPPRTPGPDQMRAVIDCYSNAMLIHCKAGVHPTPLVVKLEREIFLNGYYRAIGFGAGPCKLCGKCTPEKCTQPEKTRPAMEACGIDVYATAHANGFPIQVVRDETCEQNWYGLVLIE